MLADNKFDGNGHGRPCAGSLEFGLSGASN